MELSIIFVNWNAVEYLAEAIASVYAHTCGIDFEVIVVDNASPNGDVDTLKVRFPDITVIKAASNLGFARANNLGFLCSSGKYICLLNPDTKLVGPAINTLLDRIGSLPAAGIVGCRQVDPDLTVQTTSIQTFPTIMNQMVNIEYLRRRWPKCSLWALGPLFSDNLNPVRVEVIPGACMLLRREVFEQVGMFTEDYFMYAEDIDLNYKVAQAGFDNYYIPDAVIVHYGGKSSTQQKVSQWATIMKYRAMNQYYVKRRGRAYATMYRTAMAVCAIIRLSVFSLAVPLERILRRGSGLRFAAAKWWAVLKWAFGLDGEVLNASSGR